MKPSSIRFMLLSGVIVLFAIRAFTDASPQRNLTNAVPKQRQETAVFAGGCFWCMVSQFEELPGVLKVESGYTGGFLKNPTYRDVTSGISGHVEAVRITFDTDRLSYTDLVEVFWRSVDPTDAGGQFVDRGKSYETAIFVANAQQRKAAEASKNRLAKSGRFKQPIVTPIRAGSAFYPAEDYHQGYHRKSPLRYKMYRSGSGRDKFLDQAWGKDRKYKPVGRAKKYTKPSNAEIKAKLNSLQYRVTQEDATEPAFNNKYWDNKAEGIYVDIVSGEPLFSSKDKYRSGTGWPSFTRPLVKRNIVERTDYKLILPRTEVRSKYGNSHLGHVFNDGPAPTGKRYCMNSAALRFVPVSKLKAEGYGEFASQFTNRTSRRK